jgi:hypothetical protein
MKYVLGVECIKVAGKRIMEEATRKGERRIAVETVLRVLNARVVYRVEMTESFRL